MSSQYLTKRQVAVAALVAGLSAFVLFQNCAKATFNLPENLSSAQVATQFCDQGQAQPCEDQVGSGTRCVLNLEEPPPPPPPPNEDGNAEGGSLLKLLQASKELNICLYDNCKPGFKLQDYQCIPEVSECIPGECSIPNGHGYRFCGETPAKLGSNIASPMPGQCLPIGCFPGFTFGPGGCVPLPP